ncbi:hypothetical protein INT45_001401 [Circinella minor]|uniref:Helitron helicase-like domain-containing protein n=1 Tax=Circinella minor TaxID=1195481 RepID=A0A8H7RVE7_9FUNG|nr:hypothetical protein INT45_001401 [Circinella minor]
MSSHNQNQREDRICICGANSHLNRNHSDCPLNERNVRHRLHNDETIIVEEPEQLLESTRQRRSCLRCGSNTHQRSSHHDCPYNARNQSENQTTENQEPPVQNETIDTFEAETIRTCPSCGSPSHSWRTSRLCPFNDANIESDYRAEYQLACTLPFNAENVIGPNICYTPGKNFHRHKLSCMDAICTFCNAQMWMEERITTSSRTHPLFSICCTHGKIVLPIPRCPPQQIIGLLTAEDEASDDLFTNIRAYNNMFAFASIRANFDRNLANRSGGVSTFRINGTIYHDIGSLRLEHQAPVLQAADEQPAEQEHLPLQQQQQQQERPKFAQIYFADKEEQLATRETLFSGLRRETISTLQTVIQESNPYARGVMNAHKTYGDRPFGTLQVVIRSVANLGRRYDQQSYPEVAAMIVENTVDGESLPHEIVIRDRQSGLYTISSLHPSYIPLHYVLMFPFGDDEWSPGMQCQSADNQTNSITLLKYCSYMLMIRNGGRTTYHHHFRRLFQQFVVDNYACIEFSRLQYITNNQNDLCADLYNGIGDNVDPRQIGRSIILPSSFTGGPRCMKQMLQDGLAIIRQRGNPTLFITFTCNPQWPEIQSELLPGQQAFDRPDICSRVFHIKITEMMAHIKESNCFGRVVGYVATVEFQKRGLPHVHILLILHHQDRPRNPADYDHFVCAELPNSATHPQLYRTVTSSMIHGPCGNLNPNAICMKDGQCSQGYPKPFVAETRVSRDGYPIYRRRENIHNRHHFQCSNFIADNSHVIPYNPYLCQKYNAHINVEICTSSRAIKYLYKYLTKGSDRAQIEMVQSRESEAVRSTNPTFNTTRASNDIEPELIDEVTQFQNARYIGPCEAIWRTFEYQVHIHYSYVSRLALHLPNKQRVVFHSTDSANGLQAARNNAETTSLTAFFNLCS